MAQDFATPLDSNNSLSQSVSEISTALDTMRSGFSGASAPSDPAAVAGQPWFDTGVRSPKIHDGDDFLPLGGRLLVDTTAVGNVGTGEDDMIAETLEGGTLAANGQALRITAWGTFAANANNKRARLYFGATAVADTGVIAQNGGSWRLEALVVRTGATTQKASGMAASSDAATLGAKHTASTPAETLASNVTIKTTGEATSNDDVQCQALLVELIW